jgi:hypothetical protein
MSKNIECKNNLKDCIENCFKISFHSKIIDGNRKLFFEFDNHFPEDDGGNLLHEILLNFTGESVGENFDNSRGSVCVNPLENSDNEYEEFLELGSNLNSVLHDFYKQVDCLGDKHLLRYGFKHPIEKFKN